MSEQPPQNPYDPPSGSGDTPPPPPPPPPYETTYSDNGGYGAPMPPPTPGEMGPSFSAGAAVGYGWRAFKRNAGAFILITLASMVVGGVVSSLGGQPDELFVFDPKSAFFQFVGQVVSMFFGAAAIKGALDAVNGREVSFGKMFDGWDKGQVLLGAFIVSLATTIGMALLFIPGMIVAFFTWFTFYFIVDRGLGAIDGIKASFNFVKSNVGELIVLLFAGIGVVLLGLLALCVGVIAAIPVVTIASAYAYKVLQGQPVAVQH